MLIKMLCQLPERRVRFIPLHRMQTSVFSWSLDVTFDDCSAGFFIRTLGVHIMRIWF